MKVEIKVSNEITVELGHPKHVMRDDFLVCQINISLGILLCIIKEQEELKLKK